MFTTKRKFVRKASLESFALTVVIQWVVDRRCLSERCRHRRRLIRTVVGTLFLMPHVHVLHFGGVLASHCVQTVNDTTVTHHCAHVRYCSEELLQRTIAKCTEWNLCSESQLSIVLHKLPQRQTLVLRCQDTTYLLATLSKLTLRIHTHHCLRNLHPAEIRLRFIPRRYK